MRSRELWLWLGAACLTFGALFAAIAIAYYTKEQHFPLTTSPQIRVAEGSFVLAFLCFLAAIFGLRFPAPRPRFPNIRIDVDLQSWKNTEYTPMPEKHPKLMIPTRLCIFGVRFTSREHERTASIGHARLYAKVKPEDSWPAGEEIFTEPSWPLLPSWNLRPVSFPMNLAPGASEGGHLVFELKADWPERLADPFDARIEMEDTSTGKRSSFPATFGHFYRRHGLRATTRSERTGQINLPASGESESGPGNWQLLAPDPDRDPD